MYGSPLGKDWKVKKDSSKEQPLEKFKTLKPSLSTKTARELVETSCSVPELMWIERWLDTLVRSRSLPPQCKGKDAFNALALYLAPKDVLEVLELLRTEFLLAHPQRQKSVETNEDFAFLLAELGAYPEHQTLPPPSSRSTKTQDDDLS